MSKIDVRLVLGSTLGLVALCGFLTVLSGGPTDASPSSGGDDDGSAGSGSMSGDSGSVGGGGVGLIAEQTTQCTELFFESYTVTKDVVVCVDTDCDGGGDSGSMSRSGSAGSGADGADCDPFPHDGLFTYSYTLTNSELSNNVIIGWELDTGIPGAIVDAGYISDGGVEPCDTVLRDDGSQVEWQFFGMACMSDPLEPGESSVTLYITSPLGPGDVDSTIFGDGALDCPAICLGPAVETEVCPDGGGEGSDASGSTGAATYSPPQRSNRRSVGGPARAGRR